MTNEQLGRQRACILQWMQALLEPNQIVEIRSIGPFAARTFATSVSGEYERLVDYVTAASGNHKGIYFTPNPMRQVVGTGSTGTHQDADVLKRNWLLIDVDPSRTKDTNASQDEMNAAKSVAESIKNTLESRKFSGLVFGESGNGFHIYVPVDLPNTDLSKSKHQQLLHALDERFSTPGARVDRATFNASRIWKMPGTLTMKGPHSPDRPQRFARLNQVPNDCRVHATANTKRLDELLSHWCPKQSQIFDDDRASVVRRAMKYLEKEPPAIDGSNGSDICYHVAGVCYDGFALNEDESLAAMQTWNLRCQPPWSEKELRHKIDSVKAKGGSRGKFLQSTYAPSTNGKHEPVPAAPPTGTVIHRASTVTPRKVEWLWPARIPVGKLTTFAGVGGLGKTFCLLDIAARISRGSEWPFCNGECSPVGQTLFISGEDDPEDTLVPRLIEMDADLDKVCFLRSEVADTFTLKDLETLERAMEQSGGNVRFVAIDPPTSFLGGTDDHKNAELRGLLSPLKSWAQKHNVAIVFNTHLNKSGGQVEAMMRVMGSVAWVNAVRAAHLFVRDPDDNERRLFACMKNNLGPETKALAYRIAVTDQMARIEWLETVDTTANDAIGGNIDSKPRKVVASEWIIEQFRDQLEWPSSELFKAAKEAGISRDAVFEAKDRLNLPKAKKTTRPNGDVEWVWWVPADWPQLLGDITDEDRF